MNSGVRCEANEWARPDKRRSSDLAASVYLLGWPALARELASEIDIKNDHYVLDALHTQCLKQQKQ